MLTVVVPEPPLLEPVLGVYLTVDGQLPVDGASRDTISKCIKNGRNGFTDEVEFSIDDGTLEAVVVEDLVQATAAAAELRSDLNSGHQYVSSVS